MENRKKQRRLLRLDYITLILSIICLFIYTTLFVVFRNNYRYVFLAFDLYTIFTLYKSASSIIEYYKFQSVKKYNKSRVNLKLFNKRKSKTKKTA